MQFGTTLETGRHRRWHVADPKPANDLATPIHLITILYRSSQSFAGFLDGLQAQDRADWRLHVIDNGDPQSVAMAEARADPRISITRNPANFGFARAANQGMRKALAEGAKTVVLINNDIIMSPDLLGALCEAERQLPGAVMSPRIMDAKRPDIAGYAGGGIDRSWVYQNVHYPYDPAITEPQLVEFAPGCCLLIPTSVLDRVGFLDERFFVYWEDTDFCLRLNQAGIPIYYLPTISLLHKGGESSGGLNTPAFYRLYFASYMRFMRKHFGFTHATATLLRLARKEWEQGTLPGLMLKTGAMLKGLIR